MATLTPITFWAQRADKLWITLDVQDCTSPSISFENVDGAGKLEFKGTASEGKVYALSLPMFKEIKPDDCKIRAGPRKIELVVFKAEDNDWWPRLTKEKTKDQHIKADWDKWADEDDDEGEGGGDFDMSNMASMGNFQNMMGGGGMGGMGGMDMASMMGGMGGGMGGMDMASMMGGMAGGAEGGEDSDDEDLPDLESTE
eukprot:CAMPEP_0177767682 /NCGR_PEP_ID=MMETSP0491_2-20121128/9269_1 /TAXON_ID=63592 /ORGANISM="Tetraselmis chuii, Strain PLY429" /LENGTH=198 /DNA_ID=CAMNT_0019284341 /DNA_START=134 /DNA_END=730 /DNA_ORIENTATION=-